MKKINRAEFIPEKCARCDGDRVHRTELTMYGELGFMGPDYRFDVYICKNCGFSESYFKDAQRLA